MKKTKGPYFEITHKVTKTIDTNNQNKKWDPDKKGYFLIRVNRKTKEIDVGFVTKNHKLTTHIIGKKADLLMDAIIKERLVSNYSHAAYLGRELYKAEVALKSTKRYLQD
ncbi:DUF4346 domain-containing protein [Nanoarchaeota archaeon]